MDEKEKLEIEILVKECDSVGQEIRTLFRTSEKIIALGIGIIAAGLTLGLTEGINEILLFLPVAVLGVFFYAVLINTELMSLGGYKRYLEERINIIFRENILLWESFIAKGKRRLLIWRLLHFIYLLFFGLTIFISLHTAWQHYGRKVFWGIVILLSVLFIGLILSFIEKEKTFDKTYQMARKRLNQVIAVGTPPKMAQKE